MAAVELLEKQTGIMVIRGNELIAKADFDDSKVVTLAGSRIFSS